ncbi:MAG: hypothetical protein ABIQ31_00035 [Ferruginibacter sp.]
MNTSIILSVAAVLVILIVAIVIGMSVKPPAAKALQQPSKKSMDTLLLPAQGNDKWWIKLNKVNQLELALLLAGMALPAWEKYTSSDPASYQDTSSMLPTVIDKNLLAVSLKEIKAVASLAAGSNYQQINKCYNQFIGPVIALQDGNWAPPYAVKKIFLSCYIILKGIAENNKANYNENFFAVAIDHSLDCIDIAKLYTNMQVEQILSGYRFSL